MKWNLNYIQDEGFTLIEIMIALVVLSIGLVSLAGLQINIIKGNSISKRITTAVSIAEEIIEQLKSTPYDNIQAQLPSQINRPSGSSNLRFTRQVTVDNNSPVNNTKTVTVTVSWLDTHKTYTIPISTIISRP
jgi:prepilin-type N-terminal cleavage/methylation domain-containing protein